VQIAIGSHYRSRTTCTPTESLPPIIATAVRTTMATTTRMEQSSYTVRKILSLRRRQLIIIAVLTVDLLSTVRPPQRRWLRLKDATLARPTFARTVPKPVT
jgi:hypothetical protein